MIRRELGDIRLDPPDRSGPVEAIWNEEARTITTPYETFVAYKPMEETIQSVRKIGGKCSICRLRGMEFTGDDPCDFCGPDEVFR